MAYTISDACIGCRACAERCPTGAISGEKKEIHLIYPDTCIECGTCGRVCPSGAVLDHFGLALKRIPKTQWDRPEFNLDKCMSCTICLDTCPTSAIDQDLGKKGSPHLFPFLKNASACMGCGFCALDCPADAIDMIGRQEADHPEPVKD